MRNLVDSAAGDRRAAAPAPQLIAHRGGGWLAPENTLAAFQAAAHIGFTAFECDVKLSADGVPFLLHDDRLDRTTQATGRASWQPWSRLARVAMQALTHASDLAMPGEPFATPGIPSLADLAALLAAPLALQTAEAAAPAAAAQNLWLNLEIKPDADASAALQSDWGERIASHAARLWAAAAQAPCLSSFSIPALQGALRSAPELPRAWLCERLPEHWLGIAQALQVSALHLDATACSPALVDAAHAAGLALRLYTVNDATAMARWLALGVDGVFTDALREAAARPPLAAPNTAAPRQASTR